MAEIEFDEIKHMPAEEPASAPEQEDVLQQPEEAPREPEAVPEEEAAQEAAPSFGQQLMQSMTSDDDVESELTLEGLRHVLEALPQWILRQWKLLLLCLAGTFLYITNGYQAQMEMMEETALEAELKDWRYRSITRVSDLTMLCRQSLLEERLRQQGDTTLLPNKVAPFVINVSQ